jgi:aryl-alcohol dehydrogenase-like predicted oxidoreductase
MQMRTLGSAGLVSSAIGLGTVAFTGAYGLVTRRECGRLVALALDVGITMFDTADFLAHGEIERLLGRSLSRRGDEAIVATEGGVRQFGPDKPVVVDGSPAYLAKACEASLRRLKTDRIDLFYLHGVDPRVPIAESVGKLAELVTAGKIRYLGLRGASAEELRHAQAVHPISVVAVEYSVSRSAAERGVL